MHKGGNIFHLGKRSVEWSKATQNEQKKLSKSISTFERNLLLKVLFWLIYYLTDTALTWPIGYYLYSADLMYFNASGFLFSENFAD